MMLYIIHKDKAIGPFRYKTAADRFVAKHRLYNAVVRSETTIQKLKLPIIHRDDYSLL